MIFTLTFSSVNNYFLSDFELFDFDFLFSYLSVMKKKNKNQYIDEELYVYIKYSFVTILL